MENIGTSPFILFPYFPLLSSRHVKVEEVEIDIGDELLRNNDAAARVRARFAYKHVLFILVFVA